MGDSAMVSSMFSTELADLMRGVSEAISNSLGCSCCCIVLKNDEDKSGSLGEKRETKKPARDWAKVSLHG